MREIKSEEIRELVAQSGKTQREIAEEIGVTESTMSRYMSGEREPRRRIREAIRIACQRKRQCVLTADEAYSVANLIDSNLYDTIRNDTDIDSIQWIKNVLHAYEKMCLVSGYIGATEKRGDVDEN